MHGKWQLALWVTVTAVFSGYSLAVIAEHGYVGWMLLALEGGWSTQLFVDLVIALALASAWIGRDARLRGIVAWPYLALIAGTGCIGLLAYLVHRTWLETRAAGSSRASALAGRGAA